MLETASAVRPRHWEATRLAYVRRASPIHGDLSSLAATIEWLKRAQDATRSGGVSRGYCARPQVGSGLSFGWQPAYPETSGYIIETLLRYGQLCGDDDAIARARRIVDWEVSIQLPDGGTQGGVIGCKPIASSTFVTGQVLFGFVRAYQRFGEDEFARASRRGAAFLLSCLGEGGGFARGYSHFCAPGPKAYEVRTGWAMILCGTVLEDAKAVAGGRCTAEFALSCQTENGWFARNDLDHHDQPLTHTIGYTLEGLFEIGVLLGEKRYLEAARRTLWSIRNLMKPDGFLAGRWTADWSPAADWCCLTGSCQIACVCFRIHSYYPEERFDELGAKLLSFVAGTQKLHWPNPGLAGGIHGSYPFGGAYGAYTSLNWAAKFYADAVMDQKNLESKLKP